MRYISILFLLVFVSCNQSSMFFMPEKLAKDFQFNFPNAFVEKYIQVDKKTSIDGLLFKADSSKGLVFYIHGNAGALNTWGNIAGFYLNNHYDFFIFDYRGFGKSEGKIQSEKQLFSDVQIVYDSLKKFYPENKIILIGYSIGTGLATHLASENHPAKLILKAPYYSLEYLAKTYYPIAPKWMIRYKIQTYLFLPKVECPIVIFHGDKDEVIPVENSYKLKSLLKKSDSLVILKDVNHTRIIGNQNYKSDIQQILK